MVETHCKQDISEGHQIVLDLLQPTLERIGRRYEELKAIGHDMAKDFGSDPESLTDEELEKLANEKETVRRYLTRQRGFWSCVHAANQALSNAVEMSEENIDCDGPFRICPLEM